MAATSSGGIRRANTTCSRCSKSPKCVWTTPGSSGPNPAWYFALLAVSETLPYERPWNDPIIATTYCRPVA